VIGQLCNEDTYRQKFLDDYRHTVNCLLYVLTNCAIDSAVGLALASMVMFALKQLCANRSDQKQHIGSNAIQPLLEMLRDRDTEKSADFLSQSLLLLQMLASDLVNLAKLSELDTREVLSKIRKLPVFRQTPHLELKLSRFLETLNASDLEAM